VHNPTAASSAHLNQKPLEFMERLIAAVTEPGDVIWEPFGGLCSASVAAVALGRRAFAAETDPAFAEMAAQRLGDQGASRALRLPTAQPIGQSGRVDSQQWDERYSGAEFEWTTRPNQFVAAELAGLAPGRALDVAAGEGRNTVWLAERGWRVTAVDFSRVGLEKGRKLSAARGVDDARVEWIVADLRDYEPEPGAFDLVLIAYVQLTPELRARVLARAAAATAPGGTVFVIGHDLTNLTEGVGGPQDPDVLYTPEAVSAELTGLRVVRAERVHRTVERDDGPATAIDTLVRAVREA
jgi:SAM-dependent methyltransferase